MKHIEFDIPRGITDGDYTVQGEGEFVPGGASGDLIVRVTVVKHQTFRRDDDDIYCDKEISMVHASCLPNLTCSAARATRTLGGSGAHPVALQVSHAMSFLVSNEIFFPLRMSSSVTCCMRLQSHLMTFSRGKKSHLILKKTLHAILARLLDVHQEPPSVRVARAAEQVKFGKQDA